MASWPLNKPAISVINLALVFSILLVSCREEDPQAARTKYNLPYRLSQPGEILELPPALREISGLCYTQSGALLAVNDEEGIVYTISLKTKSTQEVLNWADKGDFEGLAEAGRSLWVLESPGKLIELRNWTGRFSVHTHSRLLPKGAEWEGLTSFSANTLVAAQKNNSTHQPQLWRVQTKGPKAQLYLTLSQTEVSSAINMNKLEKFSFHLAQLLGMAGGRPVQPSGLARHPLNKDLYVLSAKAGLLLVYSGQGKLKSTISLPKSLFLQPEAITFAPDGTLYIGNEGKGLSRPATILKFLYDER